jgi:oligopeptide/dipeptide ABC transporter ATP-binding protein
MTADLTAATNAGATGPEPVPSGAVLSVRGLTTEFVSRGTRVRAVRAVDLDLRRGEKLGIVGESGSGKSALALSILGLIESPGRVVSGTVILNGRQISALSDREMQHVRGREIAIVFQDPMTSLNPVKTIGEQILEAIRRHQSDLRRGEATDLAVELLQDVEIPNARMRLGDYPHQYSGGMRQRVMIAIALANKPDVLIADEPTTALDVTTQAQVLAVLERLAGERGTAVILITHNLGIVAEFCDTVHVMYAGRFVERAATEILFSRPVHPYTEALLRSVPRPDRLEEGPLASIPGLPPDLANIPPGCPFEPRCAEGNGRDVCRSEIPVETIVGGPGARQATVECHFARQRAEDGSVPPERP